MKKLSAGGLAKIKEEAAKILKDLDEIESQVNELEDFDFS